jgi:hypothetical protein
LKARLAVVRIASLLAPIFVTALAAADPIVAHVPVPGSPHLRAVRTTTPPVIDGTIDDDVWRLAEASSHFTQRVPNDGAEPSDPTTVRVLYDDDAVYVAFDCPQSHSALTPHLTRRDRFVEVDSVQFDLGTRGDHTSAFEFYVSASGTLADSIRFNDTDFSSDWDENWEARTHIGETGWTAEFRIPLRILRFPTRAVQSWDFQANRYISSRQESDNWAYVPRSTAGEVSHYGRLDDLRGLEERTPIEFRPFVVGERDGLLGVGRVGLEVAPDAGAHARRDVQSRLRAGRGRSGGAQPDDVRDVLPGEAAVLLGRDRRVRDAVPASVHAARRARGADSVAAARRGEQ